MVRLLFLALAGAQGGNVVISTSLGNIVFRLRDDVAPKHAAFMKTLIQQKVDINFYFLCSAMFGGKKNCPIMSSALVAKFAALDTASFLAHLDAGKNRLRSLISLPCTRVASRRLAAEIRRLRLLSRGAGLRDPGAWLTPRPAAASRHSPALPCRTSTFCVSVPPLGASASPPQPP